MSTGQGILGNNMFAYCASNPVRGVDNTGNMPSDVVPVCLSGESGAILVGTSDKQARSEELMYFLCSQIIPDTGSIYVDVQYAGIYTYKKNENLNMAISALSAIATVGVLISSAGWLSTAGAVIGVADMIYGHAEYLLPHNDLVPKDYYCYYVTINYSYNSYVRECGFFYKKTERRTARLIYLYDDTSYTNPSWYLFGFNEGDPDISFHYYDYFY